eukprot:COSAG01_NODE_2515_length_7529_cov_77.394347_5_plen_64_part_00
MLTGTWSQVPTDSSATNIQLHAIAVDAGRGPVHDDGSVSEVPCSHKTDGSTGTSVVLQAALLT